MGKDSSLIRKYNVCIKLNEKELRVFNKFCKKYKISNRAQFIRELLMRTIIEQMVEQDYPKLFDGLEVPKPQETQTQEQQQVQTEETRIQQEPEHPKLF